MPVTFILGRSGTGKTRHGLDAVLGELARPGETRRLILLVPEQASFQMERALAMRAPRGGYWRAEVLSFSRLLYRVLAETGAAPTMLSPQARALALRCVAARSPSVLHVFRAAAETHGFYVQLDRLIEELLLEHVTPEALVAAAARLSDAAARRKALEVARLYAEYLPWLGPERIDPAARLAVLQQRLDACNWLSTASIWVDGFAGFTGQELATLMALAQRAREVAITLLVDPAAPAVEDLRRVPDSLDLFWRTEVAYQRLRGLFADAGVECRPPVRLQPQRPPRFAGAPALASLEAALAVPVTASDRGRVEDEAGAVVDGDGPIRLLECPTHRDELRQAARFIRQKVAESRGALRFRDFAVIARDLEPFADTVADVFAEYEIPYFLDRRRPLRAHPLSRLVRAVFDVAATDFSVSATTRLLRSGLLPVSREQAEQLENVVVAADAHGWDLWQRGAWEFGDLTQIRRDHGARPDSAPGSVRSSGRGLDDERLHIVGVLRPLIETCHAATPTNGQRWARVLYDVLEGLGVRARLRDWIDATRRDNRWEAAETHRLAWDLLCGLLDDLAGVLGETLLRAGEVSGIINAALNELTLGLAPPTLDQVLVGAIERSRHPDIKYAWVIGFNEGLFPLRPPEDALFSAAERDALVEAGLEGVASRRDDAFNERLLAYIAFTRPSHGLVISYAVEGDDGTELQPSPLLEEVRRALPNLRVERPADDAPPVCLTELAGGLLTTRDERRGRSRLRTRHEKLGEIVAKRGEQGERLTWLLRGRRYENRPAPVGNYRVPAGVPGVVWRASPSEIETYLECPFQHFAKYGLRVDPQRGPQPLAWDLGSNAHEILAGVTRRVLGERVAVRAISDEKWQQYLHAAIAEFQARLPADFAQRRPQLAFLGQVLQVRLEDVVAVHAERWRRGRFAPLYCEQKFAAAGGPDVLRALELETAAGRVHVRGTIDRVDEVRDRSERLLLIYDYKPTATPIAAPYLTQAALQVFLYAAAVQQSLGGAGRVAGVLFAPLHPDPGVLGKQYAAEASEIEQRMHMFRPRGLFERGVAELLDSNVGGRISPVANLRRKKDGGYYANCDARVRTEIEARLDLARQTVLRAAEGVAAGRIDVAPLLERDRLACRFCPFGTVCRRDRAFNPPRVAESTLPVLAVDSNADAGVDA